MGRPGRIQGGLRGATREINELAEFLRNLTAGVTVRDLADRYPSGKTLWSVYRSGARVVPLHLLEQVVADNVPDQRGRTIALTRARQLHERAEASAARVAEEASQRVPEPADNPATSADNARPRWKKLALTGVVAAVCAVLVPLLPAAQPDGGGAPVPAPDQAPAGLYALAADRGSVLWRNPDDGRWVTVGGPAHELFVGGAGVFATHPTDGRIFRYSGRPNDWALVGESGAELAVGSDHLYRLSPRRDMVWEWVPATASWTIIGGPAAHVFAGGAGVYAISPEDGRVMRYNGMPGNWSQLGEPNDPADTYTVGRDRLYRLGARDGAVSEWVNETGSWHELGGAMRAIHAGGAGLFGIARATGAVHRYDGEWVRIGDPAVDLAVAGDEVYRIAAGPARVTRWSPGSASWTDVTATAAAIGVMGAGTD